MKRKLNVVSSEWNRLQADFLAPRVKMKESVWRHIELLFKTQADLCAVLETTPRTWRDSKSDEGVREGTAQRLLIEFVSLLRTAKEKRLAVDSPAYRAIHEELVETLDQIYSPYLRNLNFAELLEPVRS